MQAVAPDVRPIRNKENRETDSIYINLSMVKVLSVGILPPRIIIGFTLFHYTLETGKPPAVK
ncbi:MAG: hypothetical protein PHU67_01525, partial [Sulfurovum sp.]|nr:hypothetical protein [Sulfurovum sp.]